MTESDTSPRKESNIYAFQRSELLDECTCNTCLSIDGRVFDPSDDIVKFEHFCKKCRGMWVGILRDEVDPPKIEGVPDELRKQILKSIQDDVDLPEPIVNKKTLAANFLKKRISRAQ